MIWTHETNHAERKSVYHISSSYRICRRYFTLWSCCCDYQVSNSFRKSKHWWGFIVRLYNCHSGCWCSECIIKPYKIHANVHRLSYERQWAGSEKGYWAAHILTSSIWQPKKNNIIISTGINPNCSYFLRFFSNVSENYQQFRENPVGKVLNLSSNDHEIILDRCSAIKR